MNGIKRKWRRWMVLPLAVVLIAAAVVVPR